MAFNRSITVVRISVTVGVRSLVWRLGSVKLCQHGLLDKDYDNCWVTIVTLVLLRLVVIGLYRRFWSYVETSHSDRDYSCREGINSFDIWVEKKVKTTTNKTEPVFHYSYSIHRKTKSFTFKWVHWVSRRRDTIRETTDGKRIEGKWGFSPIWRFFSSN